LAVVGEPIYVEASETLGVTAASQHVSRICRSLNGAGQSSVGVIGEKAAFAFVAVGGQGATIEEFMDVLKLCGVLRVDACELGAPILSEELMDHQKRR
jgi:hypothetical protein